MTERGLKIREAFRKKYGVDHPSQLPHVKEKIKLKRESGAYDQMVQKAKTTLKEKYGSENYVNVQKAKETKHKKYGDPNYNNRKKMIETNQKKYGMNVSPNTLQSTINRVSQKEIGFESIKFKKYLDNCGVKNASQLSEVKSKKREYKIKQVVEEIFRGNRLNGMVKPVFSESDYTGSEYNKLYKFICCECGNEFEDNLYSGNIPRCLKCYPHNRFNSKIETEINEFIKSLTIHTECHNRSILNGDEIDIFLPELKIGIECNGIIWHSELFGKKEKFYHLNKTTQSLEKNIKLIHITDWEWINKKELIKSIIMSSVGKTNKIYARQCCIKQLNDKDKIDFLHKNHIQGNDKSSVRIGLYYFDELVSVMTFCKSRFDKKYQYEMSRFCCKLNFSVIGGASKMFSYFIKTYSPKSIVSYCDRRFFGGKVYEKCGMNKVGETPPNYYYFHKNNCVPINRIHFQKHKLSSILKSYDPNISEWKNMQLNGYDRIWDCGNYKYEWINL